MTLFKAIVLQVSVRAWSCEEKLKYFFKVSFQRWQSFLLLSQPGDKSEGNSTEMLQ